MFYPHTNTTGTVTPFEEQPAAAGTYKRGMMLLFNGGKLTVANNPSGRCPYICAGNATVEDGGTLTVIPNVSDLTLRCDDVVGEVTVGAKVGIVNGVQASSEASSKVLLVVAVCDDGSILVR